MQAPAAAHELHQQPRLEELIEEHGGNPFALGMHDGGTMDNHQKYQALGMQFIPKDWQRNLVICLALSPCESSTDFSTADLFSKLIFKRFGFDINKVMAALISDTIIFASFFVNSWSSSSSPSDTMPSSMRSSSSGVLIFA